MSKFLILAEKPSVANDIAAALGGFVKTGHVFESDSAVIVAARGHVATLSPEGIDPKAPWELETLPVVPTRFVPVVLDGVRDLFASLRKQLERQDIACVVNACDAGREGELIFRLIYQAARCRLPIKRVWLQSLVAESIRDAFGRQRDGADFENLEAAARCRAEADWLIGVNATRGCTTLAKLSGSTGGVVNVGRVQTPTLAFPVAREREIAAFVPTPFWEVTGRFVAAGVEYRAKLVADADAKGAEARWRFATASAAAAAVQEFGLPGSGQVNVQCEQASQRAPALYDLTTLQRDANVQFGYPVKKTLDIAQSLYERHKATTYPRTDARRLPDDYVPTAVKTLDALSLGEYASHAQQILAENWWSSVGKAVFDSASITDHFAIVPTGVVPESLTPDEASIFDMVTRRFLAVFFPPAEFQVCKFSTVVHDRLFEGRSKILVSKGWKAVELLGPNAEEDPQLGAVPPTGPAQLVNLEVDSKQTKEPARYTEATLLAAMENASSEVEDCDARAAMRDLGLGRPATRAETIEGLLASTDRAGNAKEPYLVRRGKSLVPTGKAMQLIETLSSAQAEFLVSPILTGQWERRLLDIERGRDSRTSFMDDVRATVEELVRNMRARATLHPSREISSYCGQCGEGVPIVSMGGKVRCTGCGRCAPLSVAKRSLSDTELSALFATGATPVLQGFRSKLGKAFDAALRFSPDGAGVEFSFPERPVPTKHMEQAGDPCPACRAPLRSTPKAYSCSCGFTLWRAVAGKQLTDTQVKALLAGKQTRAISGFKSSSSKQEFTAALQLDLATGKLQFHFDNAKDRHA